MDNNVNGFRQSITALRNIREWARQQRDDAIAKADGVSDPFTDLISDMSTDEDDVAGASQMAGRGNNRGDQGGTACGRGRGATGRGRAGRKPRGRGRGKAGKYQKRGRGKST